MKTRHNTQKTIDAFNQINKNSIVFNLTVFDVVITASVVGVFSAEIITNEVIFYSSRGGKKTSCNDSII